MPTFRTTAFFTAFAAATIASSVGSAARADDGIFPPAAVAKPFIDFDGKGFLVKGQRTFIASGGLEYARIPRALWRDRLLRVKRAGFNTVEIYLFWNYHEPKEGQWDFKDNRDLDAFLKLCSSLDLYVTVRVGPYVCAEWDSGGFPVWLRFKPNLSVREVNAEFEKYVDRYFDKVIPIVAANQIDRGGSVILVQLENEHPQGWGKEMPNAYFTHLRDKALSLGLEVPYFFSGLHHGSDPAGRNPWDSAGRANPWYTTEFWCDWYDIYGNPKPDAEMKEVRATWKIIAYGGNGYNYYMLHGGTNFDHFNNNEDASSYDYGAAIGQAGDLRPIYYKFKRAAMFATSFASVLENSTNATAQYADAATNPAVKVTARTSPDGTILFLDNTSKEAVETQLKFADGEILPKSGSIRIEPGEIMPIVRDFQLTSDLKLDRSTAHILGIATQGDLTTIVAYGSPGTSGAIILSGSGARAPQELHLTFTEDSKKMDFEAIGGHRIRIYSESNTGADSTYFVNTKRGAYVIAGYPYVGEVDDTRVAPRFAYETGPDTREATGSAIIGQGYESYSGRTMAVPDTTTVSATMPTMPVPVLGPWESKSLSNEAALSFTDKSWMASDDPLQMGADGDDGAYAWYRTKIKVPSAGIYTLTAGAIRDRAIPFLDGAPLAAGAARGNTITLNLTAGEHSLAILATHYGRDKIFGHLGPIDTIDAKGISGPAFLRQTSTTGTADVTGWQYLMTDRRHSNTLPGADSTGWKPAAIGEDVFDARRGYAFFRATLPPPPPRGGSADAVLHFESVDDNATVYLNGKKLGAHQGWSDAFDIPVPSGDLAPAGQPNILTVLVENTDGAGGLDKPVTLTSFSYNEPVTGWKMRGGTSDPLAVDGYGPLAPASAAGPRLYRTTFTAAPPAATGTHPILRATFAGLSHGFMYLNGHNLGRYPEKVPIDGIYLPECWLEAGENKNTLVILDEDGSAPTGVKIEVETAASRVVRESVVGSKTAAAKTRTGLPQLGASAISHASAK